MITPGDIQFAREHLEDDIHGLLLGKHKYPGVDVPSCVIQIEGLRKMRQKNSGMVFLQADCCSLPFSIGAGFFPGNGSVQTAFL